jgi:hypothetical protein
MRPGKRSASRTERSALMSDFYEPFQKLVRIVVLGRTFDVPENNLLLRQMQYVAPDIGTGKYCWNAECRYCEISYCRRAGESEQAALACRLKGQEGMVVTKAAFEIKYNMSQALAKAPKVQDSTKP